MVVFAPTKPSRSLCYRPAIISTTLGVLFLVYLTTVLLFPKVPNIIAPSSSFSETGSLNSIFSGPTEALSPAVERLVADLRRATQEAERGGVPFSYTAKERERWLERNPCRARSELPPLYARRRVQDVAPNPQWQAVLAEYATLHRTCVRKIANLTDYFVTGADVPGCKFMTGESLFGLGNKLTFAASLVLYAILTQRVVLFPEWSSSMPVTMCEPFEGSSWKVPTGLEFLSKRPMSPMGVNELRSTNATDRLLAWVDLERKHWTNASAANLAGKMYYAELDDGWQPVDRFWCDAEQEVASHVRWMSMAGCFYFVPKLFAIPRFQPTLEALFPDKLALTHILRSVFLPYDAAWDRVKRIDDMFLEKADKRVSIQVRYRMGEYEHTQLSQGVNQHITSCLLDNGILPNVTQFFSPELQRGLPRPAPIIKVLITSLYLDLQDHLSEMYLRHQTVTGESVGLLQLTHDDEQRWGLEPDTQALVEVILLSLSDTMLVTPLSTFGGVAQAYGGLRPFIIEQSKREGGSCVRADSVDMCYQQASTTYDCPHDKRRHEKEISDVVPYIQKCMAVDSSTGVHLITS
ncbi:xyloglucan fucosyltransferase [Marchantia polymorpha subsp. ruderalis]|uniref:Fucosyltransferase n=2 Tax=Marchantia polymorpha TaxID=3197 RepID=A0AAF6BWR9_MARPO|nr:hypothetical protein MARPO_0057s0027 [Marchantia polymorpha]BBN16453.1 hypothetical protein Mp_7g06430 [Marchantia polymorpha subsp. ruderalis]|eukprot:PTQ37387.1 hypothetical protein MARPO_0057s0027 [Marchantia polymorpha]